MICHAEREHTKSYTKGCLAQINLSGIILMIYRILFSLTGPS